MSVARIAEKAGVSVATVSRVLSNSRRVQPAIAEQVRRAAAELGLHSLRTRPRARGALAKRAGRAQAIGLIALGQDYQDWLGSPVMSSVIAEVMRVAEEHELAVHVGEMPDPNQMCPVVQRRAVDGALVFIPRGLEPPVADPLRRHLPIVRVMGASLGPADIDHIAPDNIAIGHLAAEHLLGKGWRRLAYLTFEPSWALSQMRAAGFASRAAEGGVVADSFLLNPLPSVRALYGPTAQAAATPEALVDAILAQRPAGLFVARDEWLVELYRLLARRGVQPGDGLEIISCDNEQVRLAPLQPRPVSIDLNAADVAARAVRRLLSRIRHPDEPPVRLLVTPRLALPPAPCAGAAPEGVWSAVTRSAG